MTPGDADQAGRGPGPKPPGGLVQTASNMVAATVITSALGVLFWAIAARQYDTAEVGTANAQISAATLLAALGQLSLGNLLIRYLPLAGRHTRSILRRTYLVIVAVSLAVGVGFVLLRHGTDIVPNPWTAAVFVIAVPTLAIFTVQDIGLMSLGAAKIVPYENAAFSAAKIALLPALVGIAVVSGPFAAWIISAFFAVAGVSWYVFGRVAPERSRTPDGIPLPGIGFVVPQAAKQYANTVFNQLYTQGMPVLVIAMLGATAAGYLAIAWLVGVSFNALIINITSSFVYQVRQGRHVTKKMVRHLSLMLGLVGGLGGLLTFLLAPFILDVIAPGYAADATPLLRLIAVSVPLQTIWLAFAAFLWLENRLGWMALGNLFVAVVALGLTAVISPSLGIVGTGVACVIAFAIMAAISAPFLIARLRWVTRGHGDRWLASEADSRTV